MFPIFLQALIFTLSYVNLKLQLSIDILLREERPTSQNEGFLSNMVSAINQYVTSPVMITNRQIAVICVF